MSARDPSVRLTWGRRFLVCEPAHFTVLYEINPYMHMALRPDEDLARVQFDGLMSSLRDVGAELEQMAPVEGLPDLVFTANAGIVDANRFIPARFRHPERQEETGYDVDWFSAAGFDVTPLDTDESLEGAGDVLPVGLTVGARDSSLHSDDQGGGLVTRAMSVGGSHAVGTAVRPALVAGYRTRSDIGAHGALGQALGVPVRSVELVDQRYYHLDLVLCPLDDRRALVAPQGLDRYGVQVIQDLVPEPIWLEDGEAENFCANSVVVGDVVVMPACSPRLDAELRRVGFDVVVAPVGEFLKAGGGCRCLTLALDVDLSPARVTPTDRINA